jgi:cardiolipin synthase A/B
MRAMRLAPMCLPLVTALCLLRCASSAAPVPAGFVAPDGNQVLEVDAGEGDAAVPIADTGTSGPAWLSQLGLQGTVTHFASPNPNGFEVPVAEFAAAKTSIDMVIFNITETTSIAALKAAAARGVVVRMIVDSALSQSDFDTLRTGGVNIRRGSSAFSLTHEKSFSVDKKRVTIMSANMTKLYASTRDFGIVTSDPGVATEWQQVFDADWANAPAGTKTTPPLSNPNLIWAPVSASSKLTELVQSATRSIALTVENISDGVFIAALRDAAARGVAIRVVTPKCPLGNPPALNYGGLATLKSVGVTVKQAVYPSTTAKPYMHQKMMLVDDTRMYVGSINFSNNSIQKSRELGIVLRDASAIAAMQSNFEADFTAAIPLPPGVPTDCP